MSGKKDILPGCGIITAVALVVFLLMVVAAALGI